MAQTLGIACCLTITISLSAIAQSVDPLLIDRSDPLIPQGYGRRALSSFEKYRIQKEITKLDEIAQDELDRGNTNSAIEHWYRRLRLTRAIEKSEIQALGKIGAIFWSENRSEDVRNVANRLIAIQAEANTAQKLPDRLLNPLAMAYESVRYLDKAIAIYEQSMAKGSTKQGKTLNKLGELYLDIFDYDNAAKIYQKKLEQNISKEEQEIILKTLIEIYDQEGQSQQSIVAKKSLIEQYSIDKKNKQIPALKIAIAFDYETLNQIEKAIQTYNKAFKMASNTKQLLIANDALMGLSRIYEKQNNINKAIDTYNKLLTIQQQSYNYYGLINTYDTLGKIYLESNRQYRAKESFQKGLNIAETINYKVEYFRERLKFL